MGSLLGQFVLRCLWCFNVVRNQFFSFFVSISNLYLSFSIRPIGDELI